MAHWYIVKVDSPALIETLTEQKFILESVSLEKAKTSRGVTKQARKPKSKVEAVTPVSRGPGRPSKAKMKKRGPGRPPKNATA
jgi:hypothetical protein